MFLRIADTAFETYDALIVGTGPAGCVVADRLAAAGKKSLLIETGKEEFDPLLQASFTTMRSAGHYSERWWPNHWVRALGGTSNAWAGYCVPLDERDFADWPISRSDLEAYYTLAAEYLERDPSINTPKSAAFDGFDFKPFSIAAPVRFGSAYRSKFSSSGNIDVLLDTSVSVLRPNGNRTAVQSMVLYSGDGLMTDIPLTENQSLVLAAGAMGNAQILQTPPDGTDIAVGNETDMVGRGLMEHPHVYKAGRAVMRPDWRLPTPPPQFGEALPALVPNDEVYRAIGNRGVTIEFASRSINDGDGTERFLIDRFGGSAKAFDLTIRSEMKPDMSNRAAVMNSRDPAGLLRIDAVCAVGSADLRAITECLSQLGETFARLDIGRVRIDNDKIFREFLGGGHTMGTTRMGSDPRSSVVNSDCRLHRYENTYVAGSSVFATGGASNPTLTFAALAARLADDLSRPS